MRQWPRVALGAVAPIVRKPVEAQLDKQYPRRPRQRARCVVLPDKTTCQLTGIESFNPADATLTQLQHLLMIELTRVFAQSVQEKLEL